MEGSAQLRQQAAALRRSSAAICNSSVFLLPQRSGDGVWIGPTAGHFRQDLSDILAKLRSAAELLLHAAARLEAKAELADVTRGVGTAN